MPSFLLFSQTLGDSLIAIANEYYHQKQFEKAIEVEQEALKIFRKSGNKIKESNLLNNIGLDYYSLGEYDSSLLYYQQALEIDLTLKKPRRIISRFKNIGIVYKKMGQYTKANEYYLRALKLCEDKQDFKEKGSILQAIANVFIDQRKPIVAISYLRETSELFLQQNDTINYAKSLANIGNAFYRVKNLDSAFFYYEKALTIKQKLKDANISPELNNIGEVYLSQKLFDSAHYYLTKAYELKIKIGNHQSIALTSNNLARLYLRQSDFRNTKKFLNISKERLDKTTSRDILADYYFLLSQFYDSIKNLKESYKYYKKWNVLQDSIFQKEKLEVLEQLNHYEKKSLAKEKELFRVEAINQRLEKKSLLFVLFGLGLVCVFIIFLIYRERKRKKILEEKNREKQKLLDDKEYWRNIGLEALEKEIPIIKQKYKLKDLYFIKSGKHNKRKEGKQGTFYLELHIKKGNESLKIIVYNQTMKNFHDLLPSAFFVRIHRSYIVNYSNVKTDLASEIRMEINDAESSWVLPVSKKYNKDYKKFKEHYRK